MQENTIICGSAKEVMETWPSESINCCISSPPYWALRDYSACDCTIDVLNPARTTAGPIKCTGGRQPDPNCPKCGGTGKNIEVEKNQLGLESDFSTYIDKLCNIYDEVKRVLRKDGTCWVNLGDTYGTVSGRMGTDIEQPKETNHASTNFKQPKANVPQKSLCLIPQRFAIEMVNRGWILRNVIIWHKPNPMPSSAKDRFTVDFEYVYFFVKSNQNLWYFRPDGKVSDKQPDYKNGVEGLDWYWGIRKKKKVKLSLWQGFKYWFEPQYEPADSPPGHKWNLNTPKTFGGDGHIGKNTQNKNRAIWELNPLGRNKRTVWTIPTQPFPEAHFATFPEKLVEPMIRSGCPEFVCTKCGKAREKIYEANSGGSIGQGDWKKGTDPLAQGNAKKISSKDFQKGKEIGYTDCGCMNYYCCNCKKYLTLKQFVLELKNDSERYKKETRISEELGKESLCQDEAIGQSSQRDKLLQNKELYNLWERILRQKDAKDLLSQMRSPMANTKGNTQQVSVGEEERETTKLQGRVNKQLRLQGNISGRKMHIGTSLCNGTKNRSQVKNRRASTPHKSHQNGQQDREFRVSNNKKPLSETFPKDTMSTLRELFQAEPLCPFCNSNQITIKPADFRPGIMIDIFAGSGTSLQVAARLRRDWIGIELKPEYIKMAEKRATQGETGLSVKEQRVGQMALWEK